MIIEGMHYNENCECEGCKRVSGKSKKIGGTSIAQALAEDRERVREWLKAEKATYSEDVAQRERTVYDHIIKCFGEYSLNKAKEDLLKREPLMSKGEMERTIRNINSSNKYI